MSNKVLFLDIDGCLNSNLFNDQNGWCEWWQKLDPAAFVKLNEIIRRTNCHIVISSAWRKYFTIEELAILFQKYGFLYPDSIISKTPDFSDQEDYFIERGEEILAWLVNNPVASYAIVDDNRVSHNEDVLAHFVWTDHRIGLTDKNVEKLISILGE